MGLHYRTVFGVECEVRTHQQSKTVWQASGKADEFFVTQEGRTENAALSNWKEFAEARIKRN